MTYRASRGDNSEGLTYFELWQDAPTMENKYAYVNTGYLRFQDGPIGEFGANGTTNEEVIEILMQRIESLDSMQGGKYGCKENRLALEKLEEALMWLNRRTQNRVLRGVEGTNKV